ncbi:mitochondrial chaperone bcs1 [Moniliophthora roreri MCA 2997]|uniref:Mitochondrial chaperone bcs1 n=2 Tax=Moniliophthora roreri TaxID=221103 RepID=V2XG47_MONRO|nr:mitochondrial chaperone bcs1 [Moniliophthora roreri MCA 2997]KAI3603967.1 mitochondrial chaperone bcs1 [Moniliophthora roreri]
MDAIKSLVQPLVGGAGGSGVIDGMKLVVLGGTVETARRVSSSAWSHFVNSFFLTAHFSEEDYPYDWLMLWLSRRPEWQRSREFETTTRSTTPGFSSKIADNSFGEEDLLDEDEDELNGDGSEDAPGRVKTRVVFQPTFDMTHTIYYRGHWLRVKRSRKSDGVEVLSISVVARSNTILKQLVLQAKREYEAEAIHRIQIYFADSHGCWRWTDSRHKRPMNSIVLNPGVKEMLLADTKDFLASEKWYADRGIPFRRGYLLHGVPGSGKSSLIHAIAGELMLDIYVVSLSSSWVSDSTLTTLMGRVPARCIVLLEDLDAAFTRSVSRDDSDKDKDKDGKDKGKDGNNDGNSNSTSSSSSSRRRRRDDQMSDINTLSLSGLLNALDGVAAAEGRILFATTNHLERLDPALSRPGRMDVWVEFKNASKWQAEALFRNFFPSVEDDDTSSRSGSSSRGTSHSRSTTSSSPSSGTRSRAESNVSRSSMSTPPPEPVALTKEEEDELAGLGIQLPSPPSEVSASPVPSEASLVNHSPPLTTRTSSSWSSPPVSPSLSSISSAIWSLPSFASSTASLLSGGGAPPPPTAVPPAKSKGRSKTPKPLPQFGENNQTYMPPPVEDSIAKASHSAKPLDKETLGRLAKKFAESIPEEEFSVAALQGYLLKNKSRPEAAAEEAAAWVQSEREMKEKLKREKAKREEERERRRKEKAEKEKEEKRKKEEEEREEKRRKEREEEERLKREKEDQEKVKQAAAAAEPKSAEHQTEPATEPATEPVQEPSTTTSTSSETIVISEAPSEPAPPPPSEPQPEPAVVSMPGSDSESESDDSDEENLPPQGSSLSRGAQSSSWSSASWGTILHGGDYDD